MDGLMSFLQNLEETLLPYVPGEHWLGLLAFAVYVLLITAGGLAAVLTRNLVRAMVGLVVAFLGVAGMYLLLASPFMAFMQLLIYIGAICVLIFFAIMLTRNNSEGGDESGWPSLAQVLYAGLAGLAPLAVCGPIIFLNADRLMTQTPLDGPLAELGQKLLEDYVVPFEIISVILLVAMAGGVFLSWEKRWRKR